MYPMRCFVAPPGYYLVGGVGCVGCVGGYFSQTAIIAADSTYQSLMGATVFTL